MICKCLICLNSFIKKNATKGKFCSCKCYWDSLKIRGEKPICECGKKLSAHEVKRCKKCFIKYNIGEKHPRWIKDRNQIKKSNERNDSAYGVWRINVWKRDSFKCKINNKDCNGRLEAHHILACRDYPELRYDINNGITLCQFHHPRVRNEEKRLSPYFMDLVSVSKI